MSTREENKEKYINAKNATLSHGIFDLDTPATRSLGRLVLDQLRTAYGLDGSTETEPGTGHIDIRFTFGKDNPDGPFHLWRVEPRDVFFPDGTPKDRLEYARTTIFEDPLELMLDIDHCLTEALQ